MYVYIELYLVCLNMYISKLCLGFQHLWTLFVFFFWYIIYKMLRLWCDMVFSALFS